MKRTWKTAIALMLIASVMMLTSCDGLFTKSVMSGAARDPAKAAAALKAKPTATLVSDAGEVADMTQAQAVVGALSAQAAADPTVITNLPDEDKQTIITAAMTAVIDLASLGDSLGSVMSGDVEDGSEEEIMNNLIGTLIDNLGACDTTCVAVILEDSVNPDGTLKDDLSDEMKSSLTMGAVAVAASSLQGSNASIESIMSAFDGSDASTPSEQVAALLGSNDPDDPKCQNLLTALTTLSALNGAGYGFNQAFGM